MKTDILVKKMILRTFKAISITLVVLLIMFEAGSVLAGSDRLGDSPVAFAIASQTLADALVDFQNDSGVNVIYKDRLVQGKATSGLSGKHSPAAGLNKLLSGTGLTYQVTAENTVVLKENKMVVAQREEEKREEVKRPLEMEQMVVTAQKREENVQDVPMSISVFSDIQIEDAGIENTLELTRFTPNVLMKQNIVANLIIIRGISSPDTSVFGPAGFYVDGISYSIPYMRNPDLFDIERVEVLKGPQGTLYGRNSESGVINIITKEPDNELQGKIFGEYSIYDTEHDNSDSYRTGGYISGPIVRDKLYLRLAGQWEDSDGFMENEYDDDDEAGKIDHLNGRVTLRWTPTDKWDISLIADAMDMDDGMGYHRLTDGPNKTDRHRINWDGANYWKQEDNGQHLRLKYEGDMFNVISVTGRNDYESKFGSDFDMSPSPLFGDAFYEYEDDIWSQELRVSSPKDSKPFEWLVGLYGFNEDTNIKLDFNAVGMMRDTEIDTRGWAVFGEGTYTFFERLHLTAGLRYDYVDLEGEQQSQFIDMITGGPKTLNFDKDLDYDEVLPKFSAAFDFTDDIMSYLTVSKGYLTGNYNYAFVTDQNNFTYDPEYTWNYEIGLKTAWLDNKLICNMAAFYTDIEDKQVSEWFPGGGPMGRTVSNAAEAHSMGVELELRARPLRGLDFFGSFGYTQAEIDDWIATEPDLSTTPPGTIQYDYEDKDLPYAPKYTYNVGVQYRHVTGFFGRADILGVSDFYSDAKNKVKIDSYELVNLRLGFEGKNFDIVFWSKNVFDERYSANKVDWRGSTLIQEGTPRMSGVTVAYRF